MNYLDVFHYSRYVDKALKLIRVVAFVIVFSATCYLLGVDAGAIAEKTPPYVITIFKVSLFLHLLYSLIDIVFKRKPTYVIVPGIERK